MLKDKKQTPRILPQNLEAEQSVLGCVLLDQDVAISIIAELRDDDFYSQAHRIIFNAMYELSNKFKPIDYITLTDELNSKASLDAVGGIEYISTLTNSVPGSANYAHYVNIVKRDSMLRKLINAGNRIVEAGMDSDDRENALAISEQLIFELSQNEEKRHSEKLGKSVDETLALFERLQKCKGSLRGLSTGFHAIDEYLNGLQKSDLILLAARPSMGKTSLAMNVVTNAALKGAKVAVFSLEMSKIQIAQRSICSIAKVNMKNSLAGNMDDSEWQAIMKASQKVKELDIYVDDTPNTYPYEILSKCRRIKREMNGLDLVMIDYLQLMCLPKPKDNRQQEISEFTRALKIAARELDVPILVLSQLNRAVELRKDHTPILADLRESGSIEQDADVVMFINKLDFYPEYQGEKNLCDIIIAKHRNGETGKIQLKWRGEFTTFVNLDRDANKASMESSKPRLPKEKKEVKDIEIATIENDEEDAF